MMNNNLLAQENSKKTYQDGFTAGYNWAIKGIVIQLKHHGNRPFDDVVNRLGLNFEKWITEEVINILLSMLDNLNNEIGILNRINEKLASENESFTHAVISLQDQLNRKNSPE